MSNNIKKELLSLMQKAVKLEVEQNGNEASRYLSKYTGYSI